MTRLRRDFPAMLKRIQISRSAMLLFVEGRIDRYFYSEIASVACAGLGKKFSILTPDEIATQLQGKNVLLEFFDYLRRRKCLVCDFKGNKGVVAFCLDKDIDDFTRRLRKSPHVIYTEGYETENYLFCFGDLSRALAVTTCTDYESIQGAIGTNKDWCTLVAERWKDWVKLCVFAASNSVPRKKFYGLRRSAVNARVFSPVDQQKVTEFWQELHHKSGKDQRTFNRMVKRTCGKVDRIYEAGEFDKVFKGKWYAAFLAENAVGIAGRKRMDKKKLPDRLVEQLLGNLDFGGPWSKYLRSRIANLLAATK